MSSIWTSPMDFFSQSPAEISSRLREFDLKTRTYQATGKYWTKVFALLKDGKTSTENQNKATGYTKDLYADLAKVFSKFKAGEVYNELNPLEKFGDKIGRQVHKMVLGNETISNSALKDIQERLEALWDDLWDLKAGDQVGFDRMFDGFAFDTWAAMGFPATTVPSFTQSSADNPSSSTETTTNSQAESSTEKDTAAADVLVGKGAAVYCPVVLPKVQVQSMFPSQLMRLNPTGLKINHDTEHVVIYCLAKQTITFSNGMSMSYQEIFPIIPNVSVDGNDGKLFQVVPVLWVSNLSVAQGARDSWKMNKLYGKFEELEKFPLDKANGINECSNAVTYSYEVANGGFESANVLKAKLNGTQAATQLSMKMAAFKPYQAMLATPMLYWSGNDLKTASFEIDFSTSTIDGATAELTNGILNGMDGQSHTLPSLENAPIGAFKLDFNWELQPVQSYPPLPG